MTSRLTVERHAKEIEELESEIIAKNAALSSTQARADKLDLALQSLTPGGSEYVNDPERCVAYVRSVRESQHNAILKAHEAKRAAESSLAAANERLPTLRNEVLEEAAARMDEFAATVRDRRTDEQMDWQDKVSEACYDSAARELRALKTAGKE